jgi:hypothetical protein
LNKDFDMPTSFSAVCAAKPSQFAYPKMTEAKSPSGQKVKRWLEPEVTAANYDALMIDKTALFPEPQGTDQMSVATLKEIAAYMDEALKRELSDVVTLADKPGPRTLKLRVAITAAAGKDMGLKPYQYLPVAFVLTAGQTTKKATLAIEYEVVARLKPGAVMCREKQDSTSAALLEEILADEEHHIDYLETQLQRRFRSLRVCCRLLDMNSQVKLRIQRFDRAEIPFFDAQSPAPTCVDVTVSGHGIVIARVSWRACRWDAEREALLLRFCDWLGSELGECC